MAKTTEEYGAKDITILEGLEAVRQRPGMYIGSTRPAGLHHLSYEVVANAVAEAMARHASRNEGTFAPDACREVVAHGPAIPCDQPHDPHREGYHSAPFRSPVQGHLLSQPPLHRSPPTPKVRHVSGAPLRRAVDGRPHAAHERPSCGSKQRAAAALIARPGKPLGGPAA